MVNEEMYRVAWRRKHDINERGLFAYIQTKLGAETKAYIKSLEGRSPQTFHITNHFNERWMLGILKDAYTKFGLKQGEFMDSVQKKAEGDLFDETWLLFLLGFFANITEFFIVLGIINTIKSDIKRFVDDKVSQGIPTAAIITLLGLYLTQKNIIRSQTIARTETTRIMNLASGVWANVQGRELKKKWIVTLDGKERPSHNAMADYPAIGSKELFLVGGSLMSGPGDGNAPAQEVVNCRCGLMYI
jgi:hypothetical protein